MASASPKPVKLTAAIPRLNEAAHSLGRRCCLGVHGSSILADSCLCAAVRSSATGDRLPVVARISLRVGVVQHVGKDRPDRLA